MIKIVDTPSNLEEEWRLHRPNSDYFTMDRVLCQKRAGFLNGRDAATQHTKV